MKVVPIFILICIANVKNNPVKDIEGIKVKNMTHSTGNSAIHTHSVKEDNNILQVKQGIKTNKPTTIDKINVVFEFPEVVVEKEDANKSLVLKPADRKGNNLNILCLKRKLYNKMERCESILYSSREIFEVKGCLTGYGRSDSGECVSIEV